MRIRKLLLAMLPVLFLISTASAGTWVCDFEDPSHADLWVPDFEGPRTGESQWEIQDGWFHQTQMEEVYYKAAVGGSEWTDFTVEFDMNMVEGPRAVAGVLLRSDETAASGFRVVLHDTNGLNLCPWADNAWKNPSVSFAFAVAQGTDYQIKCSLEGQTLSVWVDGVLLVEDYSTEAADQFESGMLGLICYGCHTKYDNITVTGDSVTALDTTPVESAGKLTIAWGGIKRGI